MVESTLAASISRPSDGPVLLVHEPYLTFYSIEIQPTLVSSQYDQPSESPPPSNFDMNKNKLFYFQIF